MGKELIEACEARFAELSEAWGNGDLTEAQFKERVAELQVQDSAGTRWQLSPTSGDWLRRAGAKWIEGGKPSDAIEPVESHPARKAIEEAIPEPAEEKPRGVKAGLGRILGKILGVLLLAYGIGLPVLHVVGPKASGTVTDIAYAGTDEDGKSRNFSVLYRFTLPDGTEETGSCDLSEAALDRAHVSVGDGIGVRYIPGAPRFNFATYTTRLNVLHVLLALVGFVILAPPRWLRRRKKK